MIELLTNHGKYEVTQRQQATRTPRANYFVQIRDTLGLASRRLTAVTPPPTYIALSLIMYHLANPVLAERKVSQEAKHSCCGLPRCTRQQGLERGPENSTRLGPQMPPGLVQGL